MHPVIENFMERPLSHKLAFWGLSLAALCFVYWQWFYSDSLTEKQELQAKIESLQTEITNEKRLIQDLGKFRNEVKELDVKLKYALQQLPDKREIPDFLKSVSDLAKEAGLEVTLFRPEPERFKEFYAEVPVNVSVEGTFHQVAAFFDEVGRLSRIVNINDIVIKDPVLDKANDRIEVKAECKTTTFRYLDESERITLAESAGEGKKRKRR